MAHAKVDRSSNEVLLLRGTSPDSAMQIVAQGFDDRLTSHTLYGAGVYFTTDFCKVLDCCKDQDTNGWHYLLLARVVLGHPFMAKDRSYPQAFLCQYKGTQRRSRGSPTVPSRCPSRPSLSSMGASPWRRKSSRLLTAQRSRTRTH